MTKENVKNSKKTEDKTSGPVKGSVEGFAAFLQSMANRKPLTEAEKTERAKRQAFDQVVGKKASEMKQTAENSLGALLNKFNTDMEKKGIEVASVGVIPVSFDTIKKDAELKVENAHIGTTFVVVVTVAPSDIPQAGEVAAHRAEVICNTIANVIKED